MFSPKKGLSAVLYEAADGKPNTMFRPPTLNSWIIPPCGRKVKASENFPEAMMEVMSGVSEV